MLILLFIGTACAQDSVIEDDDGDTAQVREQVEQIQDRVEASTATLTAIERYLADQVRAKHGECPRGWVQPPVSDYAKPDAPESFIPAPVANGPDAQGPTP